MSGDGRDLAVRIDAGGGSDGGGSGGAGGGSVSILGRGYPLPEEPDNDDRVGPSTRGVDLDRFDDRTVAPPTRVPGDVVVAGAIGSPLVVSRGVDLDEVTPEGPTVDHSPTIKWVRSTIGQADGGYIASNPPSHRGWWEQETWYSFVIPTHPGSMAGITIDLAATFAVSGYALDPAAELEAIASSTEPTDTRQGSVVAVVAPGGAVTVFVPASVVPVAGGRLYVGLRTRWQADYGQRSSHWSWPWVSSAPQLDDAGVPYQGRSGMVQSGGWADAVWSVYSGGGAGIGATVTPGDDDDAGGPFDWQDAGEEGDPLYELDPAEGLAVEATEPSARGWKLLGPEEDDDADDGSWSEYHGVRIDALFRTDAAGLTDQAGRRELELRILAEGQVSSVRAHLGDMTRASGISADGGGTIDYLAKAIAADTFYWLAMDLRAGFVRGKLWAAAGDLSEPAIWDVEAELESVDDDTADQRLVVRRLRQYLAARPGEVVVGELIGLSDGTSSIFRTAHPYVPGSIVPSVIGGLTRPTREWADEARFRLGSRPAASAIIRARYVVAAPASVDEDPDE
jgi:hypothetical protein